MAFVDNLAVGKEKVCYWLSNDIVGLVGNFLISVVLLISKLKFSFSFSSLNHVPCVHGLIG